jgi:hypothetical protein
MALHGLDLLLGQQNAKPLLQRLDSLLLRLTLLDQSGLPSQVLLDRAADQHPLAVHLVPAGQGLARPPQELDHERVPQLETVEAVARVAVDDVKVGGEPLYGVVEGVKAGPGLVLAVAALVDPETAAGGKLRLAREEVADEARILRAHIADGGTLDEGDGLRGTVAAEADVYGPAAGIGKCDDVDNVHPEISTSASSSYRYTGDNVFR